jgi:hypothetical protein
MGLLVTLTSVLYVVGTLEARGEKRSLMIDRFMLGCMIQEIFTTRIGS